MEGGHRSGCIDRQTNISVERWTNRQIGRKAEIITTNHKGGAGIQVGKLTVRLADFESEG
jgi:hypothetical protein